MHQNLQYISMHKKVSHIYYAHKGSNQRANLVLSNGNKWLATKSISINNKI